MEGSVCNIDKSFDSRSEAEHCVTVTEKRTGKPHKVFVTGICHADVIDETWWFVVPFEECFDGAIFDDWLKSNYDQAHECAKSLNHLNGGGKIDYKVELFRWNPIFRNEYQVKSVPR